MNHYVYILTHRDTNQFYIGSRSCRCNPMRDEYMGSMKTWKVDKTKLVKTIVKSDFLNRNDAMEYESNLIKFHIKNPLNENYYIPNKGFHTIGRIRTEEERTKMSVARKQRKIKDETRKKLSISTSGVNNPMYGKTQTDKSRQLIRSKAIGRKYSDETKKKLSDQRKGENHYFYGKSRTDLHKVVLQFTKDGIFIREWQSVKHAGTELNISRGNISNCCIGRIKSYKGYIWRFK